MCINDVMRMPVRHINFTINVNGLDPCLSEKRMNFSLSD